MRAQVKQYDKSSGNQVQVASYVYKQVDFGTAIGVRDVDNESKGQASESLMSFSALEFGG